MDQLATAVITPAVDSLIGVIKRHLNFCFYYKKNVTDMRARIELLKDTARDMKTRKETNVANNLMVPHHVPAWLTQVETICEEAGNVPTGGIGCFNMKTRYKAGKQSSNILRKIEVLESQESNIKWSEERRPLGRVRSTLPSTSETMFVAADEDDDGPQTGLKSRDLIFKEAMKSLDPNNKIQKIALCGMGGVGKTTMMDQLKKAVEGNKLFDWVMKVDIGKNPNPINLQKTVAEYFGKPLQETVKDTRAKSLLDRFVGISENGKKNILVILDDLWEEVDLKDIGLMNPLPKGFKLLLTSREENVCTQMGVEASSIFRIAVLEEPEAKKLFWDIVGTVSDGNINHDLRKIGEDIVTKCGGLPIAIKIIASTLRDNSVKYVWEDALKRLQDKELSFVETVFMTSYDNLKDDDEKATLLLSGLFPDDYNIPIEDLIRYGCGLKLFKTSKTVSNARCRVNTCVYNLVCSNMLIESDRKGCVKMHDLVRDFILRNFSNVKQASLVNSDDISEQLTEESYERILLKCTGMREFPAYFNQQNLALLKLLDGDKLRRFPKDFYDRMEKLEVVAYDRMDKPLLPRYSATLRTLCLNSCSLVDDISFIGDLINLEVLSFAFCGISKLPSAIGNLKRLKLLDLTECVDLCIDDSVFHKLEKLSELYMKADEGKPIRFTEDSCEGLKMLSSKLIALDVEFFESIIQPKDLSFEKLERFRISMGCQFKNSENDVYAYENTLRLFVSCKEILECKINELFVKIEKLDLSVNEMSSLEQVSMYPSQNSFCNLRVLNVYECADLTSVFTVNVASSLTKLEILEVSECPVLESLVQGENSEAKVIKFHKLKVLKLYVLPMFVSLCDTDQVMELPQLVELELFLISKDFYDRMEKLEVVAYDGICRPLLPRYLTSLRTLCLRSCKLVDDISVIGDLINLEVLIFAVCGISKLPSAIGNLKKLKLLDLTECVDLCIDDGVFHKLEKLRELYMRASGWKPIRFTEDSCEGLKLLSSKLIALDVEFSGSIIQPKILSFEKLKRFRISMGCQFENLKNDVYAYENTLKLVVSCKEVLECKVNELFEKTEKLDLSVNEMSSLEEISLHPSQHSFCNLRDLRVHKCADLTSIFTVNVASSLTKLESLTVSRCPVLGSLVQEGENSEAKVIKFHKLKFLELDWLPMFVSLCDTDQVMELPQLVELEVRKLPSIFSENNEISATRQRLLNKKIVIPNLKKLEITNMKKLKEIWSCENTSISDVEVHNFSNLRKIQAYYCPSLVNIFPCNWMRLVSDLAVINGQKQQPLSLFHNLTKIWLDHCKSIKYLFSPLLATHLSNLKNITIRNCHGMEEVVSNRDDNEDEQMTPPTTTTLFPYLDRLSLYSLPSLKHVDGGGVAKGTYNDINDRLKYSQVPVVCWSLCQYSGEIFVSDCPAMSQLIPSYVVGQILMVERLNIHNCIVMKEVFATTDINNSGGLSSYFEERSGGTNTALAIPRLTSITAHKLSNLKTMVISDCNSLEHIFTFSTLESLTELEEISIGRCKAMNVIVREENGEQTVASKAVVFPRLKSIRLTYLPNLEGFFLGVSEFNWPLLDDVKIIRCPKMMAFTSSKSTAPKLKNIHLTLGTYSPECCNFYVTTNSPQTPSMSLKKGPLSLHDTIQVNVEDNDDIEEIFASNELLQLPNLEKIQVKRCKRVKTVFEVESEGTDSELNSKSQTVVKFPKLREVDLEELDKLQCIWESNIQGMKLEFPNLTRLSIHNCGYLEYVFTSSMVGSLMQLQDLHITNCKYLRVIIEDDEDEENTEEEVSIEDEEDEENTEEEVIVKDEEDQENTEEEVSIEDEEDEENTEEEVIIKDEDYKENTEEECDGDAKVSEIIVFPCLKSLTLEDLSILEGFYLGKDLDVSLPSLNTLVIKGCENLEIFTKGRMATLELKVIETNLGLTDVGEQDINFFIITKSLC